MTRAENKAARELAGTSGPDRSRTHSLSHSPGLGRPQLRTAERGGDATGLPAIVRSRSRSRGPRRPPAGPRARRGSSHAAPGCGGRCHGARGTPGAVSPRREDPGGARGDRDRETEGQRRRETRAQPAAGWGLGAPGCGHLAGPPQPRTRSSRAAGRRHPPPAYAAPPARPADCAESAAAAGTRGAMSSRPRAGGSAPLPGRGRLLRCRRRPGAARRPLAPRRAPRAPAPPAPTPARRSRGRARSPPAAVPAPLQLGSAPRRHRPAPAPGRSSGG